MQKVRVVQNSFQFGEVSDSLIMRTDSPVYGASAQRVENMIVTAEGSLKKRYGLKHIYDYSLTYNSAHPAQSHLFKFEFDENEKYVVSVENQKVRCFQLETSGAVTLVSTITTDTNGDGLPFDQDYLQEYTYAQYGDVMFICHPLFAPRMLIRTGLTSFEITPYTFDQRADNKQTYQPYTKFQASGVSLDPSATTGTGVTFTTSDDYWDTTGTQTGGNYLDSSHVGVVIRYGESEVEITSVQSATQATGDIVDSLRRRLTVLNPLRTIDGSSTVEVTMLDHGFAGGEAITIEDASAVGGINTGSLNGARTVGSIIDENTFTFTAGGSASSAEDGGGYVKIVSHAPTLDWDEQSWSAKRGYPAAIAFHENRLCFAGTLAEPDTVWMSKIGSFFNFDVGEAEDTDSINLVAATGDVNQIRYMVSNRDLQIFTASGELYVPTYLNQAITPTNAQIRKQTPYGSEYVQPASIDGATIFVQTGGRIVREYLYTDSEDAYTSTSISTIASHLIDEPKCMAVVHSGFGLPDSYAAITLGNGDMTLFSSNRAEKRASWTRVTTDGSFCSVVAIHDRLFANIWYDNQLQLCEFDNEIGLDNWLSTTYNPTTYTGFTIMGIWSGGSSTVDLRIFMSNDVPNGSYVYFRGLQNNSVFSSLGVDLEDLNETQRWVNGVDPTYITIPYALDSPATGSGTITITPDGSPQIFQDAVLDMSDLYTSTDDITFDVIYTEGGATTYEAVGITGQSSSSDNFVFMPDLGTSGPDTNTTVYVGTKFISKVITNPVDASLGSGPATGEVRGITNVVVDVKSTKSMKVNNRSVISSEFTGKKEVRLLGYNRNPQVTIEQDEPTSMQVNGIVAELIV